ncbi:hypothetical protein RhiJN_13123 [Ceratobasidium sp. AG-Ba]|nr:hypothetical protein RhiJN_08757 [Ceratobasidium sp. AG-Ba]QRV80766.1 hypothetical protein RhiJN_08781 [Ceratobasidium sp. AG-Ba]QRV85105.1 hypothetical protein RhiJN_13123 [Ceratobasidium sp. AG-Ba]QRW13687.1 hypothetical protein RhiLY_12686 [Ceratobasidium sp. AG-Ba]
MTPHKSKKARGKARAHRTPSPTPPTLTPPLMGRRRGRPPGAGTYGPADLRVLLKIMRKILPRTPSDWAQVERRYNSAMPAERRRRADNLKQFLVHIVIESPPRFNVCAG